MRDPAAAELAHAAARTRRGHVRALRAAVNRHGRCLADGGPRAVELLSALVALEPLMAMAEVEADASRPPRRAMRATLPQGTPAPADRASAPGGAGTGP